MNSMKYDVVVIGGGVIGCAVARELSRYQVKACVVEREEDVCSGTSKANSAIVHGGFDAEPGSLKAKFNILGSQMMEELSKELDFDYKRNGSLVLCFAEEDKPALEALYEKGVKNGVKGMSIISGDEVRKREPNIEDTVVAALDVPNGGIVCPFGLTIALAENACDNGVEFQFLTEVETIEKEAEGYVLKTSKGEIHTACVVNAAGVYSDQIHNFVSEKKLHITARKGDYCLLDKEAGSLVSHTIFQLPTKMGKGVLVSPTVHGNLLTGPTATDIENKEQTATAAEELDSLMSRASLSVKGIPFRQVITSFAGLRAHEDGDDFVIGEISDAPGFFDAAGIESPGLSSAPAIGQWLAEKVAEKLNAKKKEDWNGTRKGIVRPELLSKEERAELIRKNPAYGTIICRCESVSEGEIVDAITRKEP